MKSEVKAKILQATQQNEAAVLKMGQEVGVDLLDPDGVRQFLKEHPNYQLPDTYFQMGNSQSIYINWHNPIFNHLPHSHNYFEINYVGEGQVEDTVDHTAVSLHTGELCIHNPRAEHMITRCGSEDFLVNILISKDIFQDEVIAQVGEDPALDRFFLHYLTGPDNTPHYMAFHQVPPEVTQIIDMIFDEYFNPHRSELLITSLLTLLFGNLLREYQASSQVAQIADYISAHLQDITIHDMARHFGYHEKYLSKLIHEKTGRTFKQLVTETRMRRAVHLLLYTRKSIEEISYEVGYSDPSSFYTNFHNTYGVSPRQYRIEHST